MGINDTGFMKQKVLITNESMDYITGINNIVSDYNDKINQRDGFNYAAIPKPRPSIIRIDRDVRKSSIEIYNTGTSTSHLIDIHN